MDSSDNLDVLLSRLEGVRRTGKVWSARCPAHEDRQASLSVSHGDNGGAVLHCHAGCEPGAVIAAVGLTWADLMPAADKLKAKSNRGKVKPRIIATYDYKDEAGNLLFQAVRFSPKEFRQRKPKPGGGWEWNVKAVRPVPYRLPELLAKSAPRVVVVAEGEKDCDALARIDVLATCNVGGAGKWTAAHSVFLRGRRVFILPDNDEPGRKHAHQVAQSLHGIAECVRIVELPGLPDKGDVSDWIAAGGTKAELKRLAEAAPIWTPAQRTPSTAVAPTADAETAAPYVAFPAESLPTPAREFVDAAAEALGCDTAYIALPLLASLAAAIGNTRRVKLKNSWCEPCILWTVIIGESGTLKSPALDVALDSPRRRQATEYREYADAVRQYELSAQSYDADLSEWKKKGRNAGEPPPEKPEPPKWGQRLAEDTTVEALAVLLENQPRGLLIARDELSGWINSFDAYKSARGADVAHWLSMHRAGSLLVNRKTGRSVIRVPFAAVSICGGVQPRTLAAALAGRYSGDSSEQMSKPEAEHFANGLAARLLLAYPPRVPKRWTEAEIADAVRDEMRQRFDDLFSLDAPTDENGELVPLELPLAPAAKSRFVAFYNDHATEQSELNSDLAAAWAKAEGYVPRLALLCELVADPHSTVVSDASMERGIELARWFADEAARVYAELGRESEDPDARAKRESGRLVEWIRDNGGRVTARDLTRGPRRFRGKAAAAEAALARLVEAGRGEWEDKPAGDTGGRPTREFVLKKRGDGDETCKNTGNCDVSSPSPVSASETTADRVQVTL